MKKMTKRILCSVFVLVFILTSMATTTLAVTYPDADMDISYSDNQFMNPGFETEPTVNDAWRAINKYANIKNATSSPSEKECVMPFDTEVKNGGTRSLKIEETATDSYIEIQRLKNYWSSGKNFNGMLDDGYTKLNISAYYKNVSNVKGVKVRVWYQESTGWSNYFGYDSETIELNGDEWSKIETTIDFENIVATDGTLKGKTFDLTTRSNGAGGYTGAWYVRLIPVSINDAELCTYNLDDIELKYVLSEGYKYRNLINAKTAAGEDLTEFNSNDKSSTTIATTDRTIDTAIKHSGEGSLKVNGKGWQVCAGFTPTANLEADATYYLSVWVYSDVQKFIFARYASNGKDNITNWIPGNTNSSTNATNPGAWKKFEYTFTPNDNMLNGLTTYIYFTVSSDCTVYFDDITLRKVPAEATKLAVSNLHIGNYAYGESLVVPFDKELDPFSLPTRISIGSNIGVKDAAPSLTNDGTALVLAFEEGALPVGTSTYFSFSGLKDVWGRAVDTTGSGAVSANFTIVNPVTVSANIYPDATSSTPLEAFATGDLVAKVTIKNNKSTDTTYNCAILFANYDGTELKGVNKVDVTNQVIEAGKTVTIPNPLTVSEGTKLKVFVWDGMANMLPIITAVEK